MSGPAVRTSTPDGAETVARPWPRELVLADVRALLLTRGTGEAVQRHATPSAVGVGYLVVLFSLWLLNIADLALTMHWTVNVGWAAEGNALMRHVAHLFGPGGFVAYKVLLMSFVVLVLWWLFLRFEAETAAVRGGWRLRTLEAMRSVAFAMTGALLAFYAWVVWNNLRVSGLA